MTRHLAEHCTCVEHRGYSRRWLRFLLHPLHLEARVAAHYNPDKRAAANELARQLREFQTLPPRHDCSCRCPQQSYERGYPACRECRKLQESLRRQESVEMGRTGFINAPQPSAEMLDLISGYAAA